MLRALVWKEWREQRQVLLLGLGIAAGLPLLLGAVTLVATDGAVREVSERAAPDLAATLVWPLLAALFGAGAIGSEGVDRTLDFLVSRPATRARLWTVKVATAAACLLLVMFASSALLLALTDLASSAVLLRYWQWALLPSLLVFSSALLISHRTSRPIAAAAAGALVAMSTFVVVPVAVASIVGSMTFYRNLLTGENAVRSITAFAFAPEQAIGAQMAVACALYLLASLWLFARHELRRGIGAGAAGGAALCIGVACFMSITAPALAQRALSPSWALVGEHTVSPNGAHVVFTVTHYPLSQVWVAPASGGAMRRLSRPSPAAMDPVFSSDGQWVAYFTERYGRPGLRYRDPDLWLARVDGTGARLLATDLPRSGSSGTGLQAIFSGDGRHVAVLRYTRLSLVSVSDGRSLNVDLQPHLGGEFSPRLIGSSPSGDEIFLVAFSGHYQHRVVAVETSTGATRTVARFRRGSRVIWLGAVPSQPAAHLVLLDDTDDHGRVISTVDTASGTVHEIVAGSCVEGLGNALYYVTCDGRDAGSLYRRDVGTGADTLLAEIEGGRPIGPMLVSPSGERLALVTEAGRNPGLVQVFDRHGELLSTSLLFDGPRLTAWTPDDRLIVGHTIAGSGPTLIDSNTGAIINAVLYR